MILIVLNIIFLFLLFLWPAWLVARIEDDFKSLKDKVEALELKMNNRLYDSHEQCDKKIYQVADRLYTKLKQMGRM